jgi:hypothetical protein
VDLSGIEVEEREITAGGRAVTLYVVRPEGATGTLPAFLFEHALMAHDKGAANIVFQLLLWPALDTNLDMDVTWVRYHGAIHDFALLNALRTVPSTDAALRKTAAELARHLALAS